MDLCFLRIPVGKRPNFTKQQSRGLFPGARVTRGRDWKWGDQDGGSGHVGQLTEITSWNGVERAGANVMWSLLSRNTYRTGHMGEVRFGKCSGLGLETVIPIPFSRGSRVPNFSHRYSKRHFLSSSTSVPKFCRISFSGQQSNPVSRQRFPESRSVFWSDPGIREYPLA